MRVCELDHWLTGLSSRTVGDPVNTPPCKLVAKRCIRGGTVKENRAAQPLSRVPRPRLYEQLVKQLLDYIEAEQLAPGDLLPAERDLAERLGVSRATLVQALVALEVLGVIDVQHGTGAVLVHRPRIATVIKSLR